MVVVDPSAGAAGRGAYVCPDAACVEQALIRGRLARAFRKPCASGPDLVLAVRAAARRGGVLPDDVGSGSDVCEAGVMAAKA